MRDVSPGVVSIVYELTEGRRYRVGKVNIQGNTITQDKVIRREVPMQPGQWYNSVDEDTTSRRLRNLNYFEQVQVAGVPSAEAGYRDVNINLAEKKTGSISFGAGFSSIDSIVGYFNLEQTNFDVSNPKGWFRGGGQRFGMQLRLGSERRDFKISLVEPWFLGKRLALGGELFYRDLLFLSDEYDQGSVGGAIFVRRPLGRKGYLKAEYRLEEITIDVDNIAPLELDLTGPGGIPDGVTDAEMDSLFLAEDGDYLRSAMALTYVYDSRDSNTLPRRGHRANLGATMAGGILGGDVDTYTLSASGSKHWSLPWDIIFNINGALTVVDEIGGDGVPIFERQFLGGARNLRGYEFRGTSVPAIRSPRRSSAATPLLSPRPSSPSPSLRTSGARSSGTSGSSTRIPTTSVPTRSTVMPAWDCASTCPSVRWPSTTPFRCRLKTTKPTKAGNSIST